MDERPSGLTPRQISLLLWTAMLAPLVRQAPGAALPAAGKAAWISALLTLPGAAALSLALSALLRRRAPGEGPGELLCRCVGRTPGRILSALGAAWLLFCAGFTLRAGADRLVAAVYPESESALFAGATLLLCLPPARGRLRVLGRMGEIAGPLLGALFLAAALTSLRLTEAAELLSLPKGALRDAATGSLPLLGTMSAGAFFVLLAEDTPLPKPGRTFFLPFAGLSGAAALLSVLILGAFGPVLAGEMDYPFFVLVRNLRLPRLLERGEALVAAAWVVSDYLLTASQLQMASRAASWALFGPGKERPDVLVWVCAVLTGATAWLCAGDAFALQRLGRVWIPAGDLILVWGVLPMVYAVGRLRRKI